METIGSTNLKNKLNSYLAQVAHGARFLITDHGKPVAKLVPVSDGELKSSPEIVAELLTKGVLFCRNISDNTDLKTLPKFRLKLAGVSVSDMLLEGRNR